MYRDPNRRYNYDQQYDRGTAYPTYVQRSPDIVYDVPQYPNAHLGFDDNRIVFEEERPVAVYDTGRVVHEGHRSVPVHKNHHHGLTEPRKQVHFVEHEERITESVDEKGNRKAYKESVDTEADGFIQRKHKTFELNKFGTFKPSY